MGTSGKATGVKAGIFAFTVITAMELAKYNVTVNALVPCRIIKNDSRSRRNG